MSSPSPSDASSSKGTSKLMTLCRTSITICERTGASNQHHHASVETNLIEDITRHTHRGLPVKDFLNLAFNLDDAAYEELESKVDGWDVTSDGPYKEKLAAFVNAKREEDMYQPPADIGNMFLKREEKEANVTRELRLRVVDKAPLLGTLSKSRKPDVILDALRNIADTHQHDQATDTAEHETAAQAQTKPKKSLTRLPKRLKWLQNHRARTS